MAWWNWIFCNRRHIPGAILITAGFGTQGTLTLRRPRCPHAFGQHELSHHEVIFRNGDPHSGAFSSRRAVRRNAGAERAAIINFGTSKWRKTQFECWGSGAERRGGGRAAASGRFGRVLRHFRVCGAAVLRRFLQNRSRWFTACRTGQSRMVNNFGYGEIYSFKKIYTQKL